MRESKQDSPQQATAQLRRQESATVDQHHSPVSALGRSALSAENQHGLLQLQRQYGNAYVQRLVQRSRIQPKLTMGEPGDPYEREADEVASRVVRYQEQMSHSPGFLPSVNPNPIVVQPMLQREMSSFPEEEEALQAKGDGVAEVMPSLEERITTKAGTGQPLPESVQRQMEDSFNASFDGVRIHTDTEAAQLNRSLHAEAFTYGNDIYFGANRFDPSSKGGTELLAHELTHTLQQSGIQRRAIQCRGGAKVGELSVHSNVISAGLTAGHAWLAYQPLGGALTTYGTWGNLTPIGLYRDREVSYTPGTANRTTDLDAADYGNLTSFAGANDAWSLTNNCASFAARGWRAVAGEALSYTNMIGIPNPSSLGAGIKSANGGTNSGVLGVGVAAGGGSSGGGSSSL